MKDLFITKVRIEKVRHLSNIDLALSDTERKHLILAGKNGSGKTSLLEAMKDNILYFQRPITTPVILVNGLRSEYCNIEHSGLEIFYSHSELYLSNCIISYIPVERSKFVLPDTIVPVNIEGRTLISQNLSKDFLKYILNLDYQLYGAKTDKNEMLVSNLSKWFDDFVSALREIYACKELELQRDAKNLTFKITMPDREPFGLNEMADGYAAFLEIYLELLMRFEFENAMVDYNTPAIILIDEIETHLHVELQKRVLPFLTKMFPNVQFIVSTHSPFVMTSLDNAVVFDLEKKERLERPSFYSYDTVVESFLETSMYSHELIKRFARYKELCLKERTSEEDEEFLIVKAELEIRMIPSTELYIAFQNLEKARKAVKNDTSI